VESPSSSAISSCGDLFLAQCEAFFACIDRGTLLSHQRALHAAIVSTRLASAPSPPLCFPFLSHGHVSALVQGVSTALTIYRQFAEQCIARGVAFDDPRVAAAFYRHVGVQPLALPFVVSLTEPLLLTWPTSLASARPPISPRSGAQSAADNGGSQAAVPSPQIPARPLPELELSRALFWAPFRACDGGAAVESACRVAWERVAPRLLPDRSTTCLSRPADLAPLQCLAHELRGLLEEGSDVITELKQAADQEPESSRGASLPVVSIR
jgi:hypothetical protein